MKKAVVLYLLLVFVLFFSSGCVVGQKYSYNTVVADFAASDTRAVGVATSDLRPYILSGDKTPDVVGLLRGGFGNPFNVTTESGKPLADDMTEVITASLSKKGFKVTPVIVFPKDSFDSVLEKLKATQGENLLLLTLNEWKSDTYVNAGLYYDINLKVFDKSGNKIAENTVRGNDNLGGSMNTASFTKAAVPQAFQKKLEELFNNPAIVKALQP